MRTLRKVISVTTILGMILVAGCSGVNGNETEAYEESAESILSAMSLDDKISQMIIPAIRTWDGENLTDLSAAPETADALRRHQYGGIILFAQNVEDPGQAAVLVQNLQANNLANEDVSVHIPYFMAADEEGGYGYTAYFPKDKLSGSAQVRVVTQSAGKLHTVCTQQVDF